MPNHLSSIYAELGVRSQVDPIRTGDGMMSWVTHKDHTVTHRRQEDQGGAWTGWTSLGAPDAGAIADPALICDSKGYLNLLLTRPGNDGMITLRQRHDGRFVK